MAISDFIVSIIYKTFPVKVYKKKAIVSKKSENIAPPGYWPLYFNCWLCSGVTRFACKESIIKKTFNIDCSWCGVENVVTVDREKK
jgi:transcription elongation factor Elf1